MQNAYSSPTAIASHSAHVTHTLSPLSSIMPTQVLGSPIAAGQLSPTSSRAPTSTVSAAIANGSVIPSGFTAATYETPFDSASAQSLDMPRSMGAVMQMHLGGGFAPTGLATVDPMEISAGTGVQGAAADGVRQVWANGAAGYPPPGQGAIDSVPPPAPAPTPAVNSLPTRPARSRAASGSGYISASGSRSRAASGSGYQSLIESRSRAASSASSAFMYERDEDDELDEDHDDEQEPDEGVPHKQSSQMGAASAGVDPALRAALDPLFVEFLAELCSNLDATDSKGEPIHQTLMAKKMERLDQSHDFRPFKFRIQAFTTAFSEMLAQRGFPESEVPFKKVRQYLWAQPFISRFNDDGKKAKSKGNHIWSIEAKKVPDKKWIFREFTRCIKGNPPNVAFVGLPWSWAPRVWDPQCSASAIGATFSSPSLPPWLSWEDNVLSGEAPESMKGQSLEIQAIATFQNNGKAQQLEATTNILIASVSDRNLDELVAGRESKPDMSEQQSIENSPLPSNHTPYRSPPLSSAAFPDAPSSSTVTLLPSLMPQASPPEETTPMTKTEELSDSVLLNRAHASAEAQQQQMMYEMQQQHSASQAAIHQHYASLAAAQAQSSFPQHSAAQLSYTPAPELVVDALHRAAFERTGIERSYSAPMPMDPNPQHFVSHSDTGTPSGVSMSDVHGRLASFALSSSTSQTPFTLDPKQL
ncbi:hypothetical protein T439DRAFT_171975 [Meredithblackwellia eburnea MCA 4105]